jgi:hypothetical protein
MSIRIYISVYPSNGDRAFPIITHAPVDATIGDILGDNLTLRAVLDEAGDYAAVFDGKRVLFGNPVVWYDTSEEKPLVLVPRKRLNEFVSSPSSPV